MTYIPRRALLRPRLFVIIIIIIKVVAAVGGAYKTQYTTELNE